MADANTIHLIGRVGKDPAFRTLPGGAGVLSFSLATTERWKDKKTGEKRDRTDWHQIELWGSIAEKIRDYVTKGKPVYIQGSLMYDEWTDKNGVKRRTAKIRASVIQLLASREIPGRESHPVEPPREPGEDRDDEQPFEASEEDVSWMNA